MPSMLINVFVVAYLASHNLISLPKTLQLSLPGMMSLSLVVSLMVERFLVKCIIINGERGPDMK
jgi:hypothetical protein